MRKLGLIFGIVILFSLITKAESHGSGPPFLLINDKYADSNLAVSANNPRFISGMDFSPDQKYLINSPISFRIDAEKILLPEEQKKTLEYQWQWEKDGTEQGSGLTQNHTYTTQGSHYVSISVRLTGVPEYTLIDSVRIDAVKDLSYVLPKAKIKAVRKITEKENILNFSADVTVDPSATIASYLWHVETDSYVTTAAPEYRYARGSYAKPVTLEIKDSNGFVTYDHYTFTDSPDMVADDAVQNTQSQGSLLFKVLIGCIVVTTIVIALFLTYAKRSR